jgi:hypothetical protein
MMKNIPLININENDANIDADNDNDYDNDEEPAAKKKRGCGKAHGSSAKKKMTKDGSVESNRKTDVSYEMLTTLKEQQGIK